MTKRQEKRILVITTAFSPENAVGAIRLTKVVKFLVRRGYGVTVLSPELGPANKVDQGLECPELSRVERVRIGHGPLFSRLFQKQRNKLVAKKSASEFIRDGGGAPSLASGFRVALFRLGQFVYTLLRALDWKCQVTRHLRRHYRQGDFAVVFSSYPSLGAPLAAHFARRTGLAARWVADFRDPLNYEKNSNPFIYAVNSRIQAWLLARADAVTFVTRDMAAKFRVKDRGKLHFVPNGYDPEESTELQREEGRRQLDPERLVLCYVGSLYGGARDLSAIFFGIRALIDSGSLGAGQVRFDYAGNDGSILAAQAAAADLKEAIHDHGYVGRKECLEIQNAADIVVVATWNTALDQGVIPGKLYECFLLRKPILGIVAGEVPGSELARMVEEVAGGFVLEEGGAAGADSRGLQDFIAARYRRKCEGGDVAGLYNERVEEYSYAGIAERLEAIFFPELKP